MAHGPVDLHAEQLAGEAGLLGQHEEVHVPERAQAELGIQARAVPALNQQRLDTMLLEKKKGALDLLLAEPRLQRLPDVRAVQQSFSRSRTRGSSRASRTRGSSRGAQAAPGQSARPRLGQQGRQGFELRRLHFQRRGIGAPAALKYLSQRAACAGHGGSRALQRARGGGTMSSMIGPGSRLRAAPEDHVVSCALAGEAALLDLGSGAYYGLDEVGAYVWGLLQQESRVADLLRALLLRYDVEPARCERDLLALLGQLHQAGLIIARDEPLSQTPDASL